MFCEKYERSLWCEDGKNMNKKNGFVEVVVRSMLEYDAFCLNVWWVVAEEVMVVVQRVVSRLCGYVVA